jgi:hypothetical protein
MVQDGRKLCGVQIYDTFGYGELNLRDIKERNALVQIVLVFL